jgi:VIT1/CCC1 family predicted Fe2+/Mn2+ transporter
VALGLLDPLERMSEVLFGLIMVMVFTGSISVVEAGNADVRSVLIGALGCNVAWGIVDAVLHLMGKFTTRARGLLTLTAIREASEPETAHRLIGDVLPPGLAAMLTRAEFESLRRRLSDMPSPTADAAFVRDDYLGAVGIFLLVFLSTLPVLVPFLVLHDVRVAMRASQGVAVAMLFAVGYSLGRHAGRPGWRMGLVMVAAGLVLAALTMALGG